MNHGTFAAIDNDRNLPTVDGRKNQTFALFNFAGSDGRYFSSFPPFHVSSCSTLVYDRIDNLMIPTVAWRFLFFNCHPDFLLRGDRRSRPDE